MAELPEINKIAGQMNDKLCGKTVESVTINQEKCVNESTDDFNKRLFNLKVSSVKGKGKWIIISFENKENILISVGMGGDIIYFENYPIEKKYQIKLDFTDKTGFTIKFWWFGKFFIVDESSVTSEPNTKDIAITPFDDSFTYEYFKDKLKGKKTQIKAFLLNQKNIGGIGNMYIHDILFMASLHPQEKISDMNEEKTNALYDAIIKVLRFSESKGAFALEKDFYGSGGGYTMDDFLVGYRESGFCPKCQTPILKIKTGSTSSYICTTCQKLSSK